MPSYTVVAAEQKGEVKTTEKWGAKKDVALRLKAADGVEHEAVWWADAAEALPQAGAVLEGEIKPSDYGLKFWPPKKNSGGGRGGGGGKDPGERRSIAMQHAQKCAVSILEVAANHGQYSPPSAGDVATQVKTIAATLWQQVQEAEANAPGTVKGLPVHHEPQPTGAPEPTTPSPEYPQPAPVGDVPFEAA